MTGNQSIGQSIGHGQGLRRDPQFVHLRVHSAYSLLEGALL